MKRLHNNVGRNYVKFANELAARHKVGDSLSMHQQFEFVHAIDPLSLLKGLADEAKFNLDTPPRYGLNEADFNLVRTNRRRFFTGLDKAGKRMDPPFGIWHRPDESILLVGITHKQELEEDAALAKDEARIDRLATSSRHNAAAGAEGNMNEDYDKLLKAAIGLQRKSLQTIAQLRSKVAELELLVANRDAIIEQYSSLASAVATLTIPRHVKGEAPERGEFYLGRPCLRHPELKGKRYKANNTCPGCAQDRHAKKRNTKHDQPT